METFLFLFEMLGTIAFAASGAVLGVRKGLDVFGVCFLGLTTACGGGMVRDVLLGNTPPAAFAHKTNPCLGRDFSRLPVQIAVDHVLLFVSQQQEGEKVPLARLDSANIHACASLSLIREEEHISSGLSSPGCRNLSKRVRMCRIYF